MAVIVQVSSAKRNLSVWLSCLVLTGVTLLLYWPALHFDFVNFDDPIYLTENRHVQAGLNWEGVGWAFTAREATNWHPVTWLSHMLDAQLYGMNAGRHHLTNIALHTANTLLLFLLLRRITRELWPSLWVAAMFGWHPLHIESVAWLSERKDVLSALFFMLTLFAYVAYVESLKTECAAFKARRLERAMNKKRDVCPPGSGKVGVWPLLFYLLSLLMFALGLMSKPMLVTLPFVMLLLDYWPLARTQIPFGSITDLNVEMRKLWSRLVVEKLPFLSLSAASCLVTYWAQVSGGAVASLERIPLVERLGNAIVAYGIYLKQAVWPGRLAVFYPHPHNWPPIMVMGCALLLLGTMVVVLWQSSRRPYLLVGWLWYLGMLVPVIGLVQVGDQAHADRYTYLPLIGIFVAVTWTVKGLAVQLKLFPRLAVFVLCAACLVASLFVSYRQLQHWENAEILFRHAIAVTENNYVAHNSLGNTLTDQNRLDEAMKEYRDALGISPLYADSHINIGRVLMQQGDIPRAVEHFQTAIQIKPDAALAHYNMGVALGEQGNNEEAVTAYNKALSLDPMLVRAHYNLGLALAKLGRVAEAEQVTRRALRLDPGFACAHYSLAITLLQLRRASEACEEFARAIQLDPHYMPAKYELGMALVDLGRFQEAVPVYEEILRVEPTNSVAQNNLGLVFARLGKPEAAVRYFAEVVRQEPASSSARYNLANALMAGEQYAAAATNFAEALRLKPGDTNIIAKLVFCRLRGMPSQKSDSP